MKTKLNTRKGLFASTIRVTFLILLNVIVSFLSQLLIAYFFGTTANRDAYFSAVAIPMYITAVFTGSLVVVFLPQLVRLHEKDPVKAVQFTSTIALCSAIVLSFVALVGIVFSNFIISITAYGFNKYQLEQSSHLMKILLPTIIFQSLTGLFTAVYQAHHKFIVATLAPIFTPIVIIVVLFFFGSEFGIESLAMGSLIGSVIPTVFLLIGLVRSKYLLFTFNIRDDTIYYIALTSLPLFATGILYRLTGIFERMIASNLSEGSISYLGYANQLATTLGLIVTGGIATTIFPHMAQAWAADEKQQFYRFITRGITTVFLSCSPIIAIILSLGEPIIQIVFERGVFDHASTQAVAFTFQILMGSFLFSSLGGITSKAFYVMSKTKTIAFIAVTEIFIYLLIGFWLSADYSYKGLAVALSVSTGINIFLCVFILFYKREQEGISTVGYIIVKIIGAAVVEFFLCSIVFHAIPNQLTLIVRVGIAAFLGIIVYSYLTIFVLKIADAQLFREKIVNVYHNIFGFGNYGS